MSRGRDAPETAPPDASAADPAEAGAEVNADPAVVAAAQAAIAATGPAAADAATDAADAGSLDIAAAVNQAKLATLGMLVAGVAHEVNTPLGALNSNHDVLRRAIGRLQGILEDEVVEPHELDEVRRIVKALDGILRVNDLAVERMTSLVRSLRTFGRLDRAQIDWADVHEGIDATLAILAHEARGITVEKRYGTLPRVHCHPDRLNQVWMNLAHNAVQAMADGGTLTIVTEPRADEIVVRVADTGSGIAPDALARIFEPGFTTKSGRVGMGLGLLISRQIVEQHRGRIAVRSEPGRGTEFTVVLPVAGP
jgi:two-component system, NtrC family, sensor kinase